MATGAIADRPKSSGQQQSEWLGRLLEDTAKSFNKNLNVLEAEAHLEAWSALVRKVGRPHFERALKRAIAESQFFPKVGGDQLAHSKRSEVNRSCGPELQKMRRNFMGASLPRFNDRRRRSGREANRSKIRRGSKVLLLEKGRSRMKNLALGI